MQYKNYPVKSCTTFWNSGSRTKISPESYGKKLKIRRLTRTALDHVCSRDFLLEKKRRFYKAKNQKRRGKRNTQLCSDHAQKAEKRGADETNDKVKSNHPSENSVGPGRKQQTWVVPLLLYGRLSLKLQGRGNRLVRGPCHCCHLVKYR